MASNRELLSILAENKPLSISNISLDKKTFDITKDDNVRIKYRLSTDAQVTIRLYDSSDMLIKTIAEGIQASGGEHSISWDGKNERGEAVPEGAYIYTIEAIGFDGKIVRYDPADETGGVLLKVRKPFLDIEKGEIAYVMPRAGMVRIRAGIKSGPLLRTVIDWEPRGAGKNTEKWDGKDKAGLIDLFKTPEREIFIFAYTLPDNAIIVKGEHLVDKENHINPLQGVTERRPQDKAYPVSKYEHALHARAICHEPQFQVQFSSKVPTTPDGDPILTGAVPVKVIISQKDRQHLESSRFEVMLFVDTVFLFEDEEGFTPFTYLWNTKGLTEGEHVLTINILSYDDHCGVKSRKVMIRR